MIVVPKENFVTVVSGSKRIVLDSQNQQRSSELDTVGYKLEFTSVNTFKCPFVLILSNQSSTVAIKGINRIERTDDKIGSWFFYNLYCKLGNRNVCYTLQVEQK